MTTLRTAAQQALEAMDELHRTGDTQVFDLCHRETTEALRAALAEPVQEPGDFDHGIGADRFKVVRGAFWWHVLIGDSPTEHGKFRSRASAEKMAADLLREFRNGAFVQHEAALAEPVQEPFFTEANGFPQTFVPKDRQKQAIISLTDQCAALIQERDELQKQVWRYEKNGVTCQTYRHTVEQSCAECNVQMNYAAPPQRKPEPNSDYERGFVDGMSERARRSVDKAVNAMTKCKPLAEEEIARLVTNDMVKFARAIERAHGIGEQQ